MSMMCMYIKTFHVSVIAPNTTMVVYGILFGGMHPICIYYHIIHNFALVSVNAIKTSTNCFNSSS